MRNTYSLGFRHQLATDMGFLVPLAAQEVLPGDTFRWKTSVLARVAPLVNPLMHQVDLRLSSWYVPNRIIWDEFPEWITGEDEVTQAPVVSASTSGETWLMDHMGMEPIQGVNVSALPFRAYNMVWNEFFRDIDLQTERDQDDMTLARVNWEKDYFTGARPAPQQGDAMTIPVDVGSTNVYSAGTTSGPPYSPSQNSAPAQGDYSDVNPGLSNGYLFSGLFAGGAGFGMDINEFRRAMALQRFAEARMRYGDRYVDYLRYLGINPSDGRLSRPEHLGSSSQTISFSEVLATAEGANTNVGDMSGHGITGLSARPWRKMFEEHGWVLVLAYVRPRTQYQNGIPREFWRSDPMDYWQKELEILPWQDIKQKEVFGSGDADQTWGWTPRYDEYRHRFSYVSGEMRQGGTMEDWHMARGFQTAPVLNASFLECTPTDRIYADTSIPEIVMSTIHDVTARRLVGRNEMRA